MADLTTDFAGIRSPNPFWLASAPPTNTGAQIHRAFEYGWGGAVWKTIGAPVLNVSNRYGGLHVGARRLSAINNVELISDRPLELNLREIAEVKRLWPDRAVIVSAMVESTREAWEDIVRRIEDTGADGIELNYGCPHGMAERGMGAAVGQVPEYCELITGWVTGVSSLPVIVKLTPNVSNIELPALAAVNANAHGLSLINTINSIMGVDLDSFRIKPDVGGKGSHGGYAGQAVKPIALHLLSSVAGMAAVQQRALPISGMGGVSSWQDAAEFLLLGATSVQICTAAMIHGFRIIEDLCDGLSNWLDDKGAASVSEIIGASLPRIGRFEDFDLSFRAVARIDPSKCIGCNLCYVACNDTTHQCIDLVSPEGVVVRPGYDPRENGKGILATKPRPVVREEDCVGCDMCYNVCPVENCIEMVELPPLQESVTWKQLGETRPEVTQDWDAMEAYRAQVGIEIH